MKDYKEINRLSWNNRTEIHVDSDFYDVPSFLAGKTSLKSIELERLGNLEGKKYCICNVISDKTASPWPEWEQK